MNFIWQTFNVIASDKWSSFTSRNFNSTHLLYGKRYAFVLMKENQCNGLLYCCLFLLLLFFYRKQINFDRMAAKKKYQNLNPEIINDQDHVTHTKSNYNTIFWAQFVFSHSWKYVVSVPISNYFLINYI